MIKSTEGSAKPIRMGETTITTKEYKELIEAQTRINIFADYVKASEYRIERKECARFLGFEIQEEDSDGD